MFYKRPSRPVRIKPEFSSGLRPQSGRLYDIMNPGECTQFKFVKGPVYMEDHYLRLLKANNKALGIPYVDPVLPKPTPLIPSVAPEEPELDVPDRVYLKLRILKNGTIRVKLSAAIWDLHETYYRNARKPPFKAVLQAYKGHGFSKEFLEKLKKSQEKQKALAQRIDKVFTKIFDKEPVKKVKKKVEKK